MLRQTEEIVPSVLRRGELGFILIDPSQHS